MKYLVQSTVVESHVPWGDQDALTAHLERVVATHKRVIQLEKEGKVLAAGVPCARRAYTLIVDVAGNKELTEVLRSLPAWPSQDMTCTPLYDLEDQLATDGGMLEKLKAGAKS